jgi:hypothetical protein
MLLADDETNLDLQAEGPWNTLPVRVRCTAARERLPSYREQASFHPQADRARTVKNERSIAHRFAISPPVPCVSSASGFLPASALSLHEPLRTPGAEDARCVQPTSATRTKNVYPSAVCSRLSRTAFAIRDAPRQSVAVTWLDRGNEHFHDARSASASMHLRTRCSS